jgi:hypothetical protein
MIGFKIFTVIMIAFAVWIGLSENRNYRACVERCRAQGLHFERYKPRYMFSDQKCECEDATDRSPVRTS